VKKSRFSEEKIIAVLKQAEAGVKVAELVRKHGISEATFYNWKAKYGGLDVSQLRRLKELVPSCRTPSYALSIYAGGVAMNWDAIGAIGDFVSGAGVIVTLGYLAVQIRSNTNVLRGQAQRELNSNVTAQLFASREVLEAAVKVKEKDGYDEVSKSLMNEYGLTPEQAESYWRYLSQIWGGLQADFRMGVLDDRFVSRLLSRNDNRVFWDTAAQEGFFDAAFIERVRRIEARAA
jgi:putative transposase